MNGARPPARWIYPLITTCPECGHGSTDADERAAGLSEWDSRACDHCKREFAGAEARDEAFVRGHAPDLAAWAALHLLTYRLECLTGTSRVIPVHGQFDRVYRVEAIGGSGYLSGGMSATYLEQGYLMVAVAPTPGHEDPTPVDFFVHAVGESPGSQHLPAWRELLIRARLDADTAPEFAVVSSVSAIDLFFEECVTGKPLGSGRPSSWSRAAKSRGLRRLGAGDGRLHDDVKALVDMRNAVAHGRRAEMFLPEEYQGAQEKWRDQGRFYDPYHFIAPFATFALRTTLALIRCLRRELVGKKST